MEKIGVVYLNRKAEGDLPIQRFINSYKEFRPGAHHEFLTIYKGFSENETAFAKQAFSGIEHRYITVDDGMTDIDSYLVAAESFADIDIFCFLNTFSELVCDNWLLFFSRAISNDDVGIVGATGSFESLLDSNKLISKVIWLCSNKFLKYDRRLHLQYESIIERHAPKWQRKSLVARCFSRIGNVGSKSGSEMYNASFETFWKNLISHDGVYAFLENYPPFPNPHIRSNGFMIRRRHLVPFLGRNKMSKNESYLFESGAEGLTRRIQSMGLKAKVVNSNGNVFDVEEWPKSRTFRLEQQDGLLVRDNQTRNFEHFNPLERNVLAYMTWGTSVQLPLAHISTFGIPFNIS